MQEPPKRILLGQLAARGDCVYATAVARQIKSDYPGCHLTWAIGSMSRAILNGNPHVDAVWEVPVERHDQMADAWAKFHSEAVKRTQAGEFDEAFFTQIFPDNFRNFDGTVRASIFRGYPGPITVPVTPVLRLTQAEIENVHRFAGAHGLLHQSRVILFEFTAGSAQTFIDSEFAHEAAKKIVSGVRNSRVVLTSHQPFESADPHISDGSVLSFRENAELAKYCSLLIGCSSGISWLCTSDWAKPLPTIQLLRRRTSVFASMVHDHEYFGLPAGHIIEMTDCATDHLVHCVREVFQSSFLEARKTYHESIPIRFRHYVEILEFVIRRKQYRSAIASIVTTVRRYGVRPALIFAIVGRIYTAMRALVLRPLVAAYQQFISTVRRRRD
jgi:hypothetical protein